MFTRRSTLAALTAATCLLAAGPAAAQTLSVRLGDLALTAKTAVSVPLIVTCSPFDPSLTPLGSNVSVTIEQAAGKDVAYGSAYFGGMDVPFAFACDGTEQTVPVTVLANTSGAPFHGGKAAVTAYAAAYGGVPCYPGATNCFQTTSVVTANTGTVAAKL